jgi:hypothetical protein
MFKNNIHAFFLASSLPVFAITLSYLAYNYAKNQKPVDIPIEIFGLLVPLAFGIAGIINYNAIKFGSYNSLLVGGIFGFALSLIGRFYYDIPSKLFGMQGDKQRIVHMYAPVMYALIFYIIISPLQDLLIPH